MLILSVHTHSKLYLYNISIFLYKEAHYFSYFPNLNIILVLVLQTISTDQSTEKFNLAIIMFHIFVFLHQVHNLKTE